MAQNFKYNPFGGDESTYHPDVKRKDKTPLWKRLLLIFSLALVLFLVLFVTVSAFTVNSFHKKADESLITLNSSNQSVYTNVTDPEFIRGYKEMADKAEKQGVDKKVVDLLRSVANLSSSLNEPPKEITPDTPKEQAVIIVAPYYALCDLITVVPVKHKVDAGSLCEDYSTAAREMMKEVASYNMLLDSPAGWVTPWMDKYPDVTSVENTDENRQKIKDGLQDIQ